MNADSPGVAALTDAIMRVEEEDERLGVVGRGRMVDRIYAALTPAEKLAIAEITEERLAEAVDAADAREWDLGGSRKWAAAILAALSSGEADR